jgi:adenine-specific DNA-methyltransferase
MIKYIGSKRLLVPRILAAFAAMDGVTTVADLFSGTSRVGHALKHEGFAVTANDHNRYAYTLGLCYVQADRDRVEARARRLLRELQALPPAPGYVTETFCERSRFFHPRNGARIDAIREAIAAKRLEPELEAVLLVSLMEAADRVDSTTGVQMAYLKDWAPRAHNDLELRLPDVLPGGGAALCTDAVELAGRLDVDAAYVDPPYNQHSYRGNYHVWESLVRWDKPAVYGVACKRTDCREYTSEFNSRPRSAPALARLIERLRAPRLVVSFSDEGYVPRDDLEALLAEKGRVAVVAVDYKRYVGAQIGIFDPRGRKVGRVSHLRNREYLYVVAPTADEAERAAAPSAGRSYPAAVPTAASCILRRRRPRTAAGDAHSAGTDARHQLWEAGMNWYFEVWKKYAVFTGRAHRTEFWMFALVNFCIGIAFSILVRAIGPGMLVLEWVYGLAALVPSIAVAVRRLHDTDKSGLLVLLWFIPLVGWLIVLILCALEGTRGPNRFGPDPKAGAPGWAAGSPVPPGAAPYAGGVVYPDPPVAVVYSGAPAAVRYPSTPGASAYSGSSGGAASSSDSAAPAAPDAPPAPDAPVSFGDTAAADSGVSTPQSEAPQPVAPAGWYADPGGRHQYRYWDAAQWTAHVADNGAASVDPA